MQPADRDVGGANAEGGCVERPRPHHRQCSVCFSCVVVHGFYEVHTAGPATHIFRRANVLAGQVHRPVVAVLQRWQAVLDGDVVISAVAEVVAVGEALDPFSQHGADDELAFITHVRNARPLGRGGRSAAARCASPADCRWLLLQPWWPARYSRALPASGCPVRGCAARRATVRCRP